MKYLVIGHVHADTSEVVEADYPESAIDKAGLHASLCHQCSNDLNLGEVYAHTVVEDEGSGETVYDDSSPAPTMAARPVDLHGIVARADAYKKPTRPTNASQAARDRADLVDWLRRSGVLPKEGA